MPTAAAPSSAPCPAAAPGPTARRTTSRPKSCHRAAAMPRPPPPPPPPSPHQSSSSAAPPPFPPHTAAMSRQQLELELEDTARAVSEFLRAVVAFNDPVQRLSLPKSPLEYVDDIIARNKAMKATAAALDTQRLTQRQVDAARQALQSREQCLSKAEASLREAELQLEQVVDRARTKASIIHAAEEGKVDEDLLVRYAHNISTSYTTSAPTAWHPEDPRRPFPQEFEMIRSKLAANAAADGSAPGPAGPPAS
eukprot:m.37061 g.37061  ORF g.37061 m.37061 type:complete len:252 (+) comp11493_c1_seq2:480-1235(+)